VDIDPGAVEIAKLRLWLSLVVDEDDIKNIKPLPNLDYRIMQGNSLISEFMGISFDDENSKKNIDDLEIKINKLNNDLSDIESENASYYKRNRKFDQNLLDRKNELNKIISGLQKKKNQLLKKANTDQNDISNLIKEFQKKKNEFLNESNVTRKSQLKEEVDDLLVKIFETKLKTQKADYFNRLKNIENKYSVVRNEKQRNELIKQDKEKLNKESDFNLESVGKQLKEFTSGRKIKPFFLWNLYFAEVFLSGARSASGGLNKGGFDVVIANPPYISYGLRGGQIMTHQEKKYLKRKFPNSAEYKISLYAVFMDKAIQIAKSEGGFQTFIVPDSFLLGRYFSKIRKFILRNNEIHSIMLLPYNVFDATVGFSVVYLFKRKQKIENFSITARLAHNNQEIGRHLYEEFSYSQNYFNSLKHSRFRLFFDKKTFQLISKIEHDTSGLGRMVNFSSGLIGLNGQKAIISNQKKNTKWLDGIISGSEINRYVIKPKGNYILYDKSKIKSGYDCVNYFSEKLFMRQTGDSLICAYDEYRLLALNNVHIGNLIDNNYSLKYIAAIVNSKLMHFYYKSISLETGRVMAQTDIETIDSLPIKRIGLPNQKLLIDKVKKILIFTKSKDYLQNPRKQAEVKDLEAEIDQLIYKLYDLTPEEIKIVEENT
jgi:hypothetical protein